MSHRKKIAVLFLVFLVSRLIVLFCVTAPQDVLLYARYAYEARLASHSSQFHSVYDIHPVFNHALREQGLRIPAENDHVEYPPLAIWGLGVLQHAIPESASQELFVARYVLLFRGLLFVFDALVYSGVLCLLKQEKRLPNAMVKGAVVYSVLGALLAPILYNRLDLIMAAIIFFSYFFLTRKRVFLSFFFLVVSIHVKLISLFLLPIWSIYSLFQQKRYQKDSRMFLGRREWLKFSALFVYRLLAGGVGVFLGMLPFYFFYGPAVLDFFAFHAKRGVHIESLYGTILMLFEGQAVLRYGALEWVSEWAPLYASLSVILIAAMTVWVTVLLCWKGVVSHWADSESFFLQYTVLLLLTLLLFSKVLSPQYFIWLIPFLAIWSANQNGFSMVTMVCLYGLTTLIYPVLYFDHIFIVRHGQFHDPSLLGKLALLFRNGMLAAWVLVLLFRAHRGVVLMRNGRS